MYRVTRFLLRTEQTGRSSTLRSPRLSSLLLYHQTQVASTDDPSDRNLKGNSLGDLRHVVPAKNQQLHSFHFQTMLNRYSQTGNLLVRNCSFHLDYRMTQEICNHLSQGHCTHVVFLLAPSALETLWTAMHSYTKPTEPLQPLAQPLRSFDPEVPEPSHCDQLHEQSALSISNPTRYGTSSPPSFTRVMRNTPSLVFSR